MKIDLHCHTLKVKKGESDKRNIDKENFVKKIMNAGVEIVGITNHNIFDREQYNQFVNEAKGSFQIWPGIELDVENDYDESGHLIIISNPRNVNSFSAIINKLTANSNPDEFSINIKSLIKEFEGEDVIYIAHSVGKSKSLSENIVKELEMNIKESYRLFLEPSNYKTLSVMSDNGFRAIMGSDIKNWDKYSEVQFPELKLKIDSFDKFILLAKKDVATINTLLENKEKKDLNIEITLSNSRKERLKLPIYNDVNVIFGAKGTGKTCILDGIYQKYLNEGIECSKYAAKDVDTTMANMLKINDEERNLGKFNIENLQKNMENIKNWKDINPVPIKNYIDYMKTKDNNQNKKRLKITSLKKINNNSTKKYKVTLNKYNKMEEIISGYKEIDLKKYIEKEEIEELNKINNKIKGNLFRELKDEYIQYKAKELTNHCIIKIKEKADIYSSSKSIPDSTGFLDFAKNRIKLRQYTNELLQCFELEEIKETSKIGDLDNGKQVYLKTINKMFQKNDTGFKYGKTAKKLTVIVNILKNINKSYCKNINMEIEKFSSVIKEENIILKDFVGIKKLFVNQFGIPYEPSDGEKIMLLLHKSLFASKEVYILDEPERSLGNTFINDIVVPRINELAKQRKTVIIATHNANIAVRTLPFMSILKEYENGIYKTYIGNPFTNELININNEKDKRQWREESIKILEGGKEAFYDREDVYESR